MTPFAYDPALSNEIYIAIGKVSAQWAALEYFVSRITHSLSQVYKNELSPLVKKTAFFERRNALYEGILWPNIPAHIQECVVDLTDRISKAEDDRHAIIHGMASEDDPMKSGIIVADTLVRLIRDHPKHFFSAAYTVPAIRAIAENIAFINGDLARLYLELWDVPFSPGRFAPIAK